MQLKVINEQRVLGKQFKIYGDLENPLFLAKDVAEWIGLTNQKAIANVLEAYEKLQNKLLDTMKGTKIIREETPEYIRVTYISKQKIKDKIKKIIKE